MIIDSKEQVNNYFGLRKVDDTFFRNYELPVWIKKELGNANKILDYGCGFGQNMIALKSEGYSDVYGLDIAKSSIEHCLHFDLDVKFLDLNDVKNPFDFYFDIILLSHVLEHVPKSHAIATLSTIKSEFLAPGGKLLIAVPNAQSNTCCYWAYEDWTHATLFTSGSLYYVLRAAGFENVEFLDVDCTLNDSRLKAAIRKLFLKLYKINKFFWNKITCSSYHNPSPSIFSYEIKARAY